MFRYDITKYNPEYRDGRKYLKEEWTAICDIGKSYDGKIFTEDEYRKVEDAYVQAIKLIMVHLEIPFLKIFDLIKSFEDDYFMKNVNEYKNLYEDKIVKEYFKIKNKDKYDINNVDLLIKLMLREDLGSTIVYRKGILQKKIVQVFIGYDFLMGIHINLKLDMSLIKEIENLGLFVEEF